MPVAARPTLLTCCRDEVVRRELVEELDVGHQAGPGEDALEQVVAQQGVLRHSVSHGRLERIEVVDPLTGEASLLEQVLIDIGDRRRVRIDPGRTGEDPLEDRPTLFGRKSRRDPRLQHAVALDHSPGQRIECRLIERMGDRPDQLPDSAAWQSRVGVERHHVAHIGRRRRRGPPSRQDAGRRRPAEQGVQLLELAALALPSHPPALGLVPHTPSMKQQEPRPAAGSLAVTLVELIDAGRGGSEQFIVPDNLLGVGIEPVREQRETKIAFPIGQEVHFKSTNQGFDVVLVGQQHRNHDERAEVGRHPGVEVEARERFRAEHSGDHQVHECDREVGGRDDREDRDDDDLARDRAPIPGEQQRYGKNDGGEDHKRSEISGRRVPDVRPQQPGRQRHVHSELALEGSPAVRDQVVTGIPVPRRHFDSFAEPRWRRRGHLYGPARNFGLGQQRASGQLLNSLAVAVARVEVEVGERATGPQDAVDQADALDELCPIE